MPINSIDPDEDAQLFFAADESSFVVDKTEVEDEEDEGDGEKNDDRW